MRHQEILDKMKSVICRFGPEMEDLAVVEHYKGMLLHCIRKMERCSMASNSSKSFNTEQKNEICQSEYSSMYKKHYEEQAN